MKYENALEKAIKGRLERAMELAELFGLFIIGIGTVAAMVHLIWRMVNSDGVTLTDLLLMFLYLEVFAMVGQYLKAGQLPVLYVNDFVHKSLPSALEDKNTVHAYSSKGQTAC